MLAKNEQIRPSVSMSVISVHKYIYIYAQRERVLLLKM